MSPLHPIVVMSGKYITLLTDLELSFTFQNGTGVISRYVVNKPTDNTRTVLIEQQRIRLACLWLLLLSCRLCKGSLASQEARKER